MPVQFGPTLPLVAGDTQRVARGPHPLYFLGEALDLLTIIPELAAISSDAPPPLTDAKVVPYTAVLWLMGPALIVDIEDLPLQPFLWRFIVDAQRIGDALAALLTRHGLERDVCSMSVARRRIRTLAERARRADAVAFTVRASDWYLVQVAQVPPEAAPVAHAIPDSFLIISIEHVVDADNSLSATSALEPILGPRVLLRHRNEAGGVLELAFEFLVSKAFTRLGPAAAVLRGTDAVGPELGRLIKAGAADSMVTRYQTGLDGLGALAERLALVLGERPPSTVLSHLDMATAVSHLPTHVEILCAGAPLPTAELVRGVGQIHRALGHEGTVDLARLVSNEDEASLVELQYYV